MAFYISIEKTGEDDNTASYRFVAENDRSGAFSINKKSGEVLLVEQMPGDESGRFFSRAAIKVSRAWKQGSLPERTEWAS